MELVNKAGIPPGVLNLVTGKGSEIGEELVSNKKVTKVAFTGETETGKTVMSIASRGVKRVSLELGGSDPMIICDDAEMDLAIDAALVSRFRNCGQVCMSVKRLYVQEGKYELFVQEDRRSASRKITIGDGLKKESKMGSAPFPESKRENQRAIDRRNGKRGEPPFGGKEPSEVRARSGILLLSHARRGRGPALEIDAGRGFRSRTSAFSNSRPSRKQSTSQTIHLTVWVPQSGRRTSTLR